MGYSRQAIAISITFYAFTQLLINRRKWYFLLLIVVAMLFHYAAFSACAMLLIVRNIMSVKMVLVTILITFFSFHYNADKLEPLLKYYIDPDSKMVSHGAIFRVGIWTSILCMVIVFKSKLSFILRYGINWRSMLFGYIICMILLIFGVMSTLVDRVLLYFYLIPYLGLSNIFSNIRNNTAVYGIAVWSTVLFSIIITMVWLGYALHRDGWVPYKNIIWY